MLIAAGWSIEKHKTNSRPREDLVFLLREFAAGSLHPLVICMKVSNCITLLDPFTLKHSSLEAILA